MYFTVRIEKAFSLKVGKDGVEEIKHTPINISPEPFNSGGKMENCKLKNIFTMATVNNNRMFKSGGVTEQVIKYTLYGNGSNVLK